MGNAELCGNGLVCVGVPRERLLLPSFVDSRDLVLHHLRENGLYGGIIQSPGCRIDVNRNEIVKSFLEDERKAEFLLFLDNDMAFPQQIGQVLASRRKPVVGGLYFKWGETHDPVCYGPGPSYLNEWGVMTQYYDPMRDAVFDFLEIHNAPNIGNPFIVERPIVDSLLDCRAVGTGALMIHRSVLENLPPPWFEFNGTNGEDFYFCERVIAELGLPVYCDMAVVCGHLATIPMGAGQFMNAHHLRGLNLTQYREKDVLLWLKDFFNLDEKGALEMYEQNPLEEQRALWDELNPQSAKDVSRFYKSEIMGGLYIRDLLLWNASQMFSSLRQFLTSYRECNVLEIGSGIGTVAMQMSLQRCPVVAVEINGVLREFAKFRWEGLKPNLTRSSRYREIEWVSKIPDKGAFDLVIAIDVFEHIHPDELVNTVQRLGAVTRERGMLFYHNNWGQQETYPFHYNHEEIWPQALRKGGFYEVQPPFWSMKIR